MLHRINKAIPAIWRDPSTLQIGLDGNRVILEELSLAQQQIVAALYSGVVDGQQKTLDDSVRAEQGETNSLINRLKPLLETSSKEAKHFGPWQQLVFAELARVSLDYQVNPEMVLAERWQRVVHIDQLDRTGLIITKALLASGVGTVVTHDTDVVISSDLGELGFANEALGKSRFQQLKLELEKLGLIQTEKHRLLDLSNRPSKALKISFAVISSQLAIRPKTYSRWLNRDVNHLAITYELNELSISPVIIPGQTPCLNCMQESKVDSDDAWPVIASQLLELPQIRDDASSLLTATGLSLRVILRQLDLSAGFKVSDDVENNFRAGYRVQYSTGNVQRITYDFHKLCNCIEPLELNEI